MSKGDGDVLELYSFINGDVFNDVVASTVFEENKLRSRIAPPFAFFYCE